MKKLLFFDTETNGLPINFHAPMSDTAAWPRVTQLAWELCWENGETIVKSAEYITPDGWVIPKEDFFLKNGHTTERNIELGMPMDLMLDYFIEDLNSADLLIAHNMGFDLPVITCEMHRYGKKPKKKTEKYCTKIHSTPICKIPNQWYPDEYKWPTLKEAYEFFLGPMPDGAHQADFDVWACKEVYFSIKTIE